ncbi:beta-N-acetylglucosaminidase [Flavobacterium noncentrifugens]|uniref:beta-N-acetylhexosaminidase n=1 Tax=Flavobacterium noncentrifugens TaxID=1128970 RepID=A0A1G8ZVY3_9FLAO|nr:glycoside hydrolase family 3 N-terminal domain-containing protein [Flavobacterium noncentrifugens]GEP51809.1 beta-N-acetylglucosaminidase [Flavobacterium noncentrifugens]SDK19276.1 beta-glucosidase [Flavobacterium noncentrifugens]
MKKILCNALFLGWIIFAISCAGSKNNKPVVAVPPAIISETNNEAVVYNDGYDSDVQKKWVDSVYNQLTFDEKIGQLFMVAAYSNKDSAHIKSIDKLITENKVGGLIFFQGGPLRQARLTNRFQSKTKLPLFIGIDAEWGLSMRLDSTYRFPWNMTLGAIKDKNLIRKVGEKMGYQTKRMGIQFNFAPVLDINTNPKNPIIGFRSFGESKENVAESASAIMKGFQSSGILSTGKHFPGHGDTETDSHYGLPVVNFSRERLEETEFYPYKQLFKDGLESVMVAHLNVPALEPRPNYPSSISYNVVTNVLQKHLGFNGLIFTDALNMKAASNYLKPGEIDLEAFLAGNDILLFAENVPVAYEKICAAYQDTIITPERLAHSVKKILKYKYKSGLNQYKPIDLKNLYTDLNSSDNDALQYQLYENAITILKNKNDILPINNLETSKIAYVKLGDDANSSFISTLKKYTEVTEVADDNTDSLNVKLKAFNTVIVGFHKSDKAWKSHAFSDAELLKLQQIAKNNVVILDAFTKPYSLMQIASLDEIEGVVQSYQNSNIAQEVSAEIIFGAVEAKGKLPVSVTPHFKVGDGIDTQKINRLGFTAPENVGMNPAILSQIDQIAKKAIDKKMTPGLQVLVARKGKVIYQKSFGSHTYDNAVKVVNSDLYDIASLTKIVSTLPNVMQQYDQKKINLESTVGEMLPTFKNSDKEAITFKELLSHYARLQAWIPFYQSTLDANKKPSDKYYRKISDSQFSKQVADSLFIRNDYHDTIMKMIIDSKLLPKKEYKYSDFTFIMLRDYLERTTGKSLDVLSEDHFFRPLGMNNTTYNPLKKFSNYIIPPTEVDNYFRYQTIQGYVHDMAAAMDGGVAGHAGIFSNAMDVAKIMQMYLQKGNYGNHQYFSAKTFDEFNTCHYCAEGNRRGLGFDKPQPAGTPGPTCGCVSSESFGHTGFTGGIAWADPETEIVYVFLSNRTFPESTVNTLSKENIREDIQKIIQSAIIR